MKSFLAATLMIGTAFAANADDAPAPGAIFQIFDKFTIAQVIGESCGAPTLEDATAYMEKFRQVGTLAEAQAYRMNPSLAPGEFAEFSAKHRHALQSGVKRFLQDKGCGAEDAVALVQEYRTLLALDLSEFTAN